MVKQEQLNILRQGVATWNTWRTQHPEILINLVRVNLSRTKFYEDNPGNPKFSGVDLSGVDLSRASLVGANLKGVNFSGANLSRANLIGADLSGADLSGADLSRAQLIGASFSTGYLRFRYNSKDHRTEGDYIEANLKGTDLSGAIIGSTTFSNVDLSKTKGLETINHQQPSFISINTIYKSQGKIPEVFLRGTGAQESFIENITALTNQPIEYYTCFISYSSKDELFAQRLHNDLQQEGVRCWFAPEDLNVGDKIRHRIDESIRLYDKLLLILSESSINSHWVAYEVEQALAKEPKGKPNVLYPVRVDKTILTCRKQWAKEIKESRHIGNFENWTDPQQYQENFKRLLRALNTKKK